ALGCSPMQRWFCPTADNSPERVLWGEDPFGTSLPDVRRARDALLLGARATRVRIERVSLESQGVAARAQRACRPPIGRRGGGNPEVRSHRFYLRLLHG